MKNIQLLWYFYQMEEIQQARKETNREITA